MDKHVTYGGSYELGTAACHCLFPLSFSRLAPGDRIAFRRAIPEDIAMDTLLTHSCLRLRL